MLHSAVAQQLPPALRAVRTATVLLILFILGLFMQTFFLTISK